MLGLKVMGGGFQKRSAAQLGMLKKKHGVTASCGHGMFSRQFLAYPAFPFGIDKGPIGERTQKGLLRRSRVHSWR